MKEDYLHFLWRMRFLPSRNFALEDGAEIEVVEFGEYNENESGPDFFHARIILDGIIIFGHIEFHLKGSDWYKHKHQYDPAYENVILHVVWEHDRQVFVNERKLPTLLLSKYIQNDFSENYRMNSASPSSLPCQYAIDEVDDVFIEKEKESSIAHRMHRKTLQFTQSSNLGFAQILYELIATAFGTKVNREPFLQLSKEMPIVRLVKMGQRKRVGAIESISGVFESAVNANTKMTISQWKKKGLHPKGAPEIRVKQFAHFVAHFNFDFGFLELSTVEFVQYVRASFSLAEVDEVRFTKSFQDLIIINAFVPFLWWLGQQRGEEKWESMAYEVLERLPKEQNHLIKFLKNAGFNIQSAYDSQALLELYSLRCSRKKCLTCGIGNQILGR